MINNSSGNPTQPPHVCSLSNNNNAHYSDEESGENEDNHLMPRSRADTENDYINSNNDNNNNNNNMVDPDDNDSDAVITTTTTTTPTHGRNKSKDNTKNNNNNNIIQENNSMQQQQHVTDNGSVVVTDIDQTASTTTTPEEEVPQGDEPPSQSTSKIKTTSSTQPPESAMKSSNSKRARNQQQQSLQQQAVLVATEGDASATTSTDSTPAVARRTVAFNLQAVTSSSVIDSGGIGDEDVMALTTTAEMAKAVEKERSDVALLFHVWWLRGGLFVMPVVTIIHILQFALLNPSKWETFTILISIDLLALGYVVGMWWATTAFPERFMTHAQRYPFYVLSMVLTNLGFILVSWVNGVESLAYMVLTSVDIISVALMVRPSILVSFLALYALVVVFRSYDLTFGCPEEHQVRHPGDCVFYIYHEEYTSPVYRFAWVFATHALVFVVIIVTTQQLSKTLSDQRVRLHHTLVIASHIVELLKSMRIEEAKGELMSRTDIMPSLVNRLLLLCKTMEKFRPFLPHGVHMPNRRRTSSAKSSRNSSSGTSHGTNPATDADGSNPRAFQSLIPLAFDASIPNLDKKDDDELEEYISQSSVLLPGGENRTTSLETTELFVVTIQYDTTKPSRLLSEVDSITVCLTVVVKEVKRRKGVVHSYRDGQVIATWPTQDMSMNDVLRAATTITHTLSWSHGVVAHCGIDVSKCLTGTVATSSQLSFNELSGRAVRLSHALCVIGQQLGAQVVATEPIHRRLIPGKYITRQIGFARCTFPVPRAATTYGHMREIAPVARIYEIVSGKSVERYMSTNESFEWGVDSLFSGMTNARVIAKARFQAVLDKNPQDDVAKTYVQWLADAGTSVTNVNSSTCGDSRSSTSVMSSPAAATETRLTSVGAASGASSSSATSNNAETTIQITPATPTSS
eukprot:PhM_4_TR4447/c0_g1_i1/m.97001